ncbi:C45 family peptidase [Gramella sp. AN32]|uniref:C45 family autoproteolytic acyltransferase/hydrolase n=1 Tax=Christiangramia antarctica TaxID=2058158 RepID=A0ABW5X059_9FLAO|nr:C45 family peptidase [Gramella sp. AN32]MCM4156768.1 acyl-CoA--6-aminopenicillanic acid acyl-transferase [Gramella sp. AN32]
MKYWYLLSVILIMQACGVKKSMRQKPDISSIEQIDTNRIKHSETHYSLGKNSLYQNKFGIWELYLEGSPLEMGIANGNLSRELIHHQENAFMGKLENMVPSEVYRDFLKKTVAWFNRKMYLHVPEEYKQEIYGVSRYALPKYNDFAPAYIRMLYFHGAHDIGHALQDLMLVGCTSFAAWEEKTEDGELLIGRNFDFYAGDEFGSQKIAAFYNPDKGNKFMMYTWGGMIGAVSGMNEKGVTVTINAGKSKIPLIAKTPVTLVAREILQYAENTEEAIKIAKKREVFVSESIMVGSASEKKAILIEVSPHDLGVYEVGNSSQLICSNQFQSNTYKNDRRNKKTIEESHSNYRFQRMTELISETQKITPEIAVSILRNRKGVEGEELGMGNEKAINQLLAHHGIIFQPQDKKVWVSANPYQMGAFVSYDLEEVFQKFQKGNVPASVMNEESLIPESDFIHTSAFSNYKKFRKLEQEVKLKLEHKILILEAKAMQLTRYNPEFWESHFLAGRIYYQHKSYKKAYQKFLTASEKVITTMQDAKELQKFIRKTRRKL